MILQNQEKKKRWTKHPNPESDELLIRSFREDPAPGTHTVKYQSKVDEIEITHTAHSREGFARGAVMVAEGLPGKKGVLGMDDFL